MNKKLTYKRLCEVLQYDPDTGLLYWKIDMGSRAKMGNIAGTLNKIGYFVIRIDGNLYLAHRLSYMIHYKTIIIDEVDHIDGNRSNNIITNLRECDRSKNNHNRQIGRDNTSGVKGVFWNAKRNKFVVKIRINNHQKHIGYFDLIEDAISAIQKAREELHGEFANHG